MTFMDALYIYLIVGLVLFAINAFLVGYAGQEFTKDDFMSAVLWPMTILQLMGMLTAIIIKSIKSKKGPK